MGYQKDDLSEPTTGDALIKEEKEIEYFLRSRLENSTSTEISIPCEMVEKTIQELQKLRSKIDELLSHIASIPTQDFDAMIAPIEDDEDDD